MKALTSLAVVKAWGRILRAMGQGKRNFGKGWGKGFMTAEAANQAEQQAQFNSRKRVEALDLQNFRSQESFRKWKPVEALGKGNAEEGKYHGKGKDKDHARPTARAKTRTRSA